jgi:hypothetical protein
MLKKLKLEERHPRRSAVAQLPERHVDVQTSKKTARRYRPFALFKIVRAGSFEIILTLP